MATATYVPVEEYLSTSYEPDREYVDGTLVERNVGERQHSFIQAALATYLNNLRRADRRFAVFTEQRLLIGPGEQRPRYRIPDVCVMAPGYARTSVLAEPPALVAEILSPDDRMSDVFQKIGDYLCFGVGAIWIVDPAEKKLFTADSDSLREVKNQTGRFHCGGEELAVDFRPIFAELDEA
jgi:Uma2 family endonuclease